MNSIWVVRAGREGIYADDFLQNGVVCIGWADLGDVSHDIQKSNLLNLHRQVYQDQTNSQAQVGVSQVLRFMNEIKIDDTVLTYDRDKQTYYVGRIISSYQWNPVLVPDLPRVREVKWTHRVLRSQLSVEARNTLGAIQTLFLVKGNVAGEIQSRAIPLDEEWIQAKTLPELAQIEVEAEVQMERSLRLELLERVEEAIEDKMNRLSWDDMQELTAGILRAMGYRTTVSPRGSDRGVDVFASPDGLGLEEPRIFVEVKHRPLQSVGAQDVRAFLGGRSGRDRCLYVSTGGFTKEARYEAERANMPVRLLGIVDLRKLLVDYYDQMDEQAKSLIPLKRVYMVAD